MFRWEKAEPRDREQSMGGRGQKSLFEVTCGSCDLEAEVPTSTL